MSGSAEQPEVKETAYQVELAKIAKEKWEDYQTRFIPFENQWIADVTKDPANKVKQVKGMVNADLAQQTATGVSSGVDPSSGAARVNTAGSALGTTAAKASVEAGAEAKDKQIQGMESVLDLGRGTSSNAELGYENIASDSVKKAISDAESDFKESSSVKSAIGQGVGFGLGLYSKSGNSALWG